MSNAPLTLRHERFVQEYLKDGNATQAYVRAGYSRRSAQPCASRLLAQPHIAAAIAIGRRHLAQVLEVAVVEQMRVGLEKAAQARRPGIIGLKVRSHRKQEKRVTPRPGRPQPGLTAQKRKLFVERCAASEKALNHRKQEQLWLARQLDEARTSLADAQAPRDAAGAPRPMENHSNRR